MSIEYRECIFDHDSVFFMSGPRALPFPLFFVDHNHARLSGISMPEQNIICFPIQPRKQRPAINNNNMRRKGQIL